MMKVTWFRNGPEERNDLLRFGLMRLHYAKEIRYVERPFTDAQSAGFSPAIFRQQTHRHLSFIKVEDASRKFFCLVDNEDSFALITPLIGEVDVAFCAGYNSDFFEHQEFVRPYEWQTENDVAWYRQTMEEKMEAFGQQFYKVKPFVPIGANQSSPLRLNAWQQKQRNLLHRMNRLAGAGDNFADVYKGFELREAYMNNLRKATLQHDVVLSDSLWGWPQHRIALHHRLRELKEQGRRIYSVLNYTEPVVCDGSVHLTLDKKFFPMITQPIERPYETMLAESRLAVFACGFHWGWRNIMTFALKVGIPVLTDRLLVEPYFNMKEFRFFETEKEDWSDVDLLLSNLGIAQWQDIKQHNQQVYDQYLKPEAVGRYFLQAVIDETRQHTKKANVAEEKWKNLSPL